MFEVCIFSTTVPSLLSLKTRRPSWQDEDEYWHNNDPTDSSYSNVSSNDLFHDEHIKYLNTYNPVGRCNFDTPLCYYDASGNLFMTSSCNDVMSSFYGYDMMTMPVAG